MEPIILGLILTAAWQGIVSNRTDAAFLQACSMGIKALKRDGDKIVNHDLEKALKWSFLKAQQTIAEKCKQELANERESFRQKDEIKWLDGKDGKLNQLEEQLKKIEEDKEPVGIPIQSLDEIELLLMPNSELDPHRVQKVKQKLQAAGLENGPVAHRCYKSKVEQELFELVSFYFVYKFKEDEKVFNIFMGQSLVEMNLKVDQIYTWLEPIIKQLTPPSLKINWQQVCREILETKEQQRLTTNRLMFGEITHEIGDVYVPLGLVERKQQTKRRDDVSPEQGSKLYAETEITQKFEHDGFLEQVLKQGRSPKSQGKRLAIIGEPGAGKTTLLQQIANWVSQEIEQAIVIWVSLADLRGKELEQYLFENWLQAVVRRAGKAEAPVATKDDFVTQFNSGCVWLLLDGVDEMSAQWGNPLAEIERQIRTAGCIPQARVVLTCRLNVWDSSSNDLNTFDTYRPLEFSYPEQVGLFIERWFGKIDHLERGQGLRTALDQSGKEQIQDLVKNPLRLVLLCRTWQSLDADLPDTKAKLYKQFVNVFYQWKDQEPRLSWTEQQELNGALGQLAREAMTTESARFQIRVSLAHQVMGESMFGLADRLGWLNVVSRDAETDEPIYAFLHPTFQEYFAATAISDWDFFLPREHIDRPVVAHDKPGKYKPYRIFEPQWKEVILLWLGREDVTKDQKELFIQAVVEFKDGLKDFSFYSLRAYFIAASGIAEFREYTHADEIVVSIVRMNTGYFDPEQQKWIIQPSTVGFIVEKAQAVLQETDRIKAIATLVELIQTSQHKIILQLAAKSLGQIDKSNEIAIRTLVELIGDDQDESSRWILAMTLGEIDKGNLIAVKTLVELIRTSQDEKILELATDALSKIGTSNPNDVDAIVELIQKSQDESTLSIVAETLGKIGTSNLNTVVALVELIQKDQYSYNVSNRAIESLGEIGISSPTAVAALIELIQNSSQKQFILFNLAASLGKISRANPKIVNTIVELILKYPNGFTYLQAVEKLREPVTFNTQAVDALVELILNYEVELTCGRLAAWSLGKIARSNPNAIAALNKLIKTSQDEFILQLAAESLAEISTSNPKSIDALVELIQTPDNETICWLAAQSLGKTGKFNSKAIDALVELIQNSHIDENTRLQAAYSLWQIDNGNQIAVSTLIESIRNSDDESILLEAVILLSEMQLGRSNSETISALVELIRNFSDELHSTLAAEKLGEIGAFNPEAVAALVELIQNSQDEAIRRLAVKNLAITGTSNPSAVTALVNIFQKSQDGITLLNAVESLKTISGEAHMARVVTALKDYLAEQTLENEHTTRALNCYGVIQHYAQNMPYPGFYQAWHSPPLALHPEVPETTGVGLTAHSQSLNLAELPQLLRAAIDSNSELKDKVQLICIDSSRFIDRDNPAAYIYTRMIRGGCPRCNDGTPQTMPELQAYWDLLPMESDQRVILVFYGTPTAPAPQEFSPTFLDALSKFDGAICVISDQPQIPLQTFSATQSNLVEAVVAWIHRMVLEN